MASTSDCDKVDETFVHTFRFDQSDEVLSLTQEQLERIPYLNVFVSNADNFSCCRSEDNAFVLNHQIQYTLFNPIYSAIVDRKPSYLFAKLPRHADVLSMLELYDYLCIDPLPVPSLKPILKMMNDYATLFHEEHHKARPSEARDTAVEFILAIANRKYDLNNRETVEIIFDLLVDVLSSVSVFGQRFRYQTLAVIENCCSHIFTSEQHDLLRAYKRSLEILNDSDADPDDASQFLEVSYTHSFFWRKRSRGSESINSFLHFLSYWPSRHFNYLGSSDLYDFDRWYLYDFDWHWRSRRCEHCYQRNRFARLERRLGCKISCPCGFLNHWAKIEYKSNPSDDLRLVQKFYLGDSSQLKHMDFKLATCLMKCCSKLQSAKNKRERRFVRSGRSHYLLSAPAVDKFKNTSHMKVRKYQR